MSTPKVTIVTVCYNSADTIEKTILSVLSQTYDNVEYIIVDGGSTDGTLDVIRKYSSRITRWVSEPDKGTFDAMNKAVGMATGDYVNFMNAGDLFFDENVLTDVFAGGDCDEDVIYGSTLQRYHGGYKAHISGPVDSMNEAMPFCHQSSFTRVDVLRRHPFDTSYRAIAVCMLFRWLYGNGGTFRRVDKLVAIYDMYGYSSDASLGTYFESCVAYKRRPTLRGYFSRVIRNMLMPLRYSSLRFALASRKHRPGGNPKYARSREAFRQMPS